MSITFTSNPTAPVSSSSPSPSPSSNSGGGGGGAPTGFYRNLFYILIGLLCAFGLVSFLSLLRARRRRMAIIREASRLGVLVPGLPGYVPVRERSMMTWFRVDGSDRPEFWDALQEDKKPDASSTAELVDSAPVDHVRFKPLGVIPPSEKLSREPPPASPLSYFPNHLAYRPDSLVPPPSRFKANNLATLDGLDGERVEVVTIIQMPKEPWPPGREVMEEEEVVKEWSCVELGILHIDVKRGPDGPAMGG